MVNNTLEKPKVFKNKLKRNEWPHKNDIKIFANLSINETVEKLNVETLGLTEKYISKHQKSKRVLKKEHKKKYRFAFWKHLLKNLKEPFTLLLLAIAIYNLVMYGLEQNITNIAGGLLVVFLVGASIIFDISAEYSMHKSNNKIKTGSNELVGCLRNIILSPNTLLTSEDILLQKVTRIRKEELFVGDIIYLRSGDVVPVDCKVIHKNNLKLTQEVMNGAKTPIEKKAFNTYNGDNLFQLTNILYRGTKVVDGSCWAIVIYKSAETYFEFKQAKAKNNQPKSIFFDKVKDVTKFLVRSVIIFVPMIFILAVILEGFSTDFKNIDIYLDSLVFSMAIAVALAPDALPLIMTSAFSKSRKLLAKKNIISRDITAVQNIGVMDVVMIDYEDIFVHKNFRLEEIVNLKLEADSEIAKLSLLSFLASPSDNRDINSAIAKSRKMIGLKNQINDKYKVIRTISSLAHPGVYTTVVEDKQGQRWAISRGALTTILNSCNKFNDTNNEVKAINKQNLNKTLQEAFVAITNKSYISVGIAIKKVNDINKDNEEEIIKDNFTLIGLVNLKQEAKPKVNEQLKLLSKSALSLKLFSQRTLEYALSMTKNLDFKVSDYISGPEIQNMTDKELQKVVEKINLFYDMDPLTEVRVINILKKLKHTVGYIGRDLNSSLQILNANVGITTHDSDVFAKNCANMLIGNDGIYEVLTAIKQSRRSLVNVMKFVKIKTVWSISITIKLIIGLFLLGNESISEIQLLVQNLIFDFVEYMIIYDWVDERYTKRPVSWDTKSILKFAIWNGVIIQIISLVNLAITGFVLYPDMFSDIKNGVEGYESKLAILQTIIWTEDSIIHLISVLIIRNHYKSILTDNAAYGLLLSILIAGILFFIIPFIPEIKFTFNIQPPKFEWYLYSLGLFVIYTILASLWKWIYVHYFHKWL
ncbi:Mg(2+) transport ATPase, P-type [Williamsoniiplasma somnilux]|uniref:Mg(2+) transport ATPase, P-type n=1 Tax=Williamsoniiplasma somnilux TaxID=215578 RepID=A0A2K8NYD0_9MOLU|nr:cation-translocating P-type ATPase [Williamsoniiplasma somnilux]ATZ18754.1 Mg(2+) transport ATPase, P-type [Williamsoniiplasma somnilux]